MFGRFVFCGLFVCKSLNTIYLKVFCEKKMCKTLNFNRTVLLFYFTPIFNF